MKRLLPMILCTLATIAFATKPIPENTATMLGKTLVNDAKAWCEFEVWGREENTLFVWALCEVTDMPDVLQGAMTSIGAWGGTRTLHWAELRYFGGTREDDKLKQGKE